MFIPEFLLLFSFNWEKVGLNYANTNITKCSMMTSLSKSLVFNFTQNAFIYSMILMDQWEWYTPGFNFMKLPMHKTGLAPATLATRWRAPSWHWNPSRWRCHCWWIKLICHGDLLTSNTCSVVCVWPISQTAMWIWASANWACLFAHPCLTLWANWEASTNSFDLPHIGLDDPGSPMCIDECKEKHCAHAHAQML